MAASDKNSLDLKYCEDGTNAGAVFVQDCRNYDGAQVRINKSNVETFEQLLRAIKKEIELSESESFVITTTNREEVKDNEAWENIEEGETLYVLKDVDQELPIQTQERVTFLPHYDTIVKGGMYEYYASEGQNPLPYALAELIDNALAATAENTGSRDIEIRLFLEDDRPNKKHMIVVLDNGKGMTSRQLNNWAIYRLSKFIRKDDRRTSDTSAVVEEPLAPRSLNSDISYFGVGGKQAVFFIGSSARMISKAKGYKDVHELLMSKEEFEQKEKNKEAIYSGYIRNRKPGDSSHLKDEDQELKAIINEEADRNSFTAVVITGINQSHLNYLRTGVKEWSRQLANIYHYYLHGPQGNVDPSDLSRHVIAQFENVSKINIKVVVNTRNPNPIVIDLKDCTDDNQTRFIRSAASTFEFKATVEGTGIVEGLLRYHPFLYDRETYPKECLLPDQEFDDDNDPLSDTRPARGKRPVFDCYWNGRLIPYTNIDEFEWCSVPKKNRPVPPECYNRISGVLWTNDKFQVSTNKLTFIDLELKLREKDTAYARIVTKDSKKVGRRVISETLEKRTDIGREFVSWLKECHEQCDKQIKFCKYVNTISRPDLPKHRQGPWGVFESVEWDNKVYKKGSMVRIMRVLPIAYGSVQRFLLYGDYDGDVYATGGDVEIRLEPRSLWDEVKAFPLPKLDRNATAQQIKKYIEDEEGRLPDRLVVTFPSGDEVKDGDVRPAGLTIGDIKIEISNRRGELISKLPGSQQKKLLIEFKLTYHASGGDQIIATYISQHGKTWPYWFRKIENLRNTGNYTLQLQTLLNESGGANTVAGKPLPTHVVKFTITEADPVKFSIGFLEGPFRIGVPFQIPLEFQDDFGHLTKPSSELKPELDAPGLTITYKDVHVKGNTLLIQDIVSLGSVSNTLGKNFNLVVRVPGLPEDSHTLKIRMLPGLPSKINVLPEDEQEIENGNEVVYNVEMVDQSGNLTTGSRLSVSCRFPQRSEMSPVVADCPNSAVQLHVPINLKKMNGEVRLQAMIEVNGVRGVTPVERIIKVIPNQHPSNIEVSYVDSNGQTVLIKQRQDLLGICGDSIKGIVFCLKDEGGRTKPVDADLAQKIKVNWTPKLSREMLLGGCLPDIRLPTLVADTKYCQISLTDGSGVEFGFNVKGLAGEPAQLKCSLSGSSKMRLGEKLDGDIDVSVRDRHGNEIKKFEKGVLKDLTVSGPGLIVEDTVRMLGKTSGFNISEIKFEPGPLGSREICVNFRKLVDYVRVEIIPGPPAKLVIPGLDVSNLISVYNGNMLPKELIVQMCDQADNPTPEADIKVQLIRDSTLKLTPAPQPQKTDKKGRVNFGVFTISGKSGVYELQLKAFIGRNIITGPDILLSVQPDATKPVSFNIFYEPHDVYVAGNAMPDFKVNIMAENDTTLTCAKPSYLRMKMWRVENFGQAAKPPQNCSCFGPDEEDNKNATCDGGNFTFSHRTLPETAGKYNIVFVYDDQKNNLLSSVIQMTVNGGPPTVLVPLQDPGTPTVSNAMNVSSRTLIRSLQLELQDNFSNPAGTDLNGRVLVEITNSGRASEMPVLVGNTTRLQLSLVKGRAQIQNIMIQENSPGIDGQEYGLRFTVEIPSERRLVVPPYELSFLFYNDLKKQSQMAMLSKDRDSLSMAIRTYKSLFETTDQLITELRSSVNDAKREENIFKTELLKKGIKEAQLSQTTLDRTILAKVNEKQHILQRPRRICGLQPASNDPDVVGKIGHLAEVTDTAIAVVLSWHMSADMDCVVTLTTKKAQEIYKQSNGRQQVLPLDSIFKKSLPEWDKPLPHFRTRPHWKPPGNPEYARNTLRFPKDEDSCRIVFGMLLGDTLLLDTLDDATAYRQEIVKFTHCPTILTRNGDRIRSNGKFGGLMNKALPLDKLRGAVFGEPVATEYEDVVSQIEVLHKYKASVFKRREAEQDLNEQLKNQSAPEMKAKRLECKEAEERLKQVEAKLGVSSRMSWSSPATFVPLIPPAEAEQSRQRNRRSAGDALTAAAQEPSAKRARRY